MRNRDYSHPSLTDFAGIAGSFCAVIARPPTGPSSQLNTVHRLLPEVYAAALRLPTTSVLFEEDQSGDQNDDLPDATGGSTAVHQLLPGLIILAEFLGPHRFYREIFDPFSDPTEAECTGDLVDDLADIHRDLSLGLAQWQDGNSGAALWTWRFRFETHWGEHATSALRALFALSAWRDFSWPAGSD